MPDFRYVQTHDLRIRCAVEGEGPLVILVHGFPESWFSWRKQLRPIAQAGFTACAIDVRGYGGSDKPWAIEAYDLENIIEDVTCVAYAYSADAPVVLVGHDWGAPIVWNTALTRPDRVRAVAGLSVPFTGVPKRPFTDIFKEAFTDKGLFFYQAYFQQVGPPEDELEADVRASLAKFYFGIAGDAPKGSWPTKPVDAKLLDGLVDPEVFPDWLKPAELDYYVRQFLESGFRGPLNRYRNHERDFAWLQRFEGWRIEQPALYIGGTKDPAASGFGRMSDPIAFMRQFVPNLQVAEMLEGCGHWTQQERPDEVNALLIPWLKALPR